MKIDKCVNDVMVCYGHKDADRAVVTNGTVFLQSEQHILVNRAKGVDPALLRLEITELGGDWSTYREAGVDDRFLGIADADY